MKTKSSLLPLLFAAALPCVAQDQSAGFGPVLIAPETPPDAPPTATIIEEPSAVAPQMPGGTRLDKVQFESCPLPEIIAFLESKEQEASGRSLNVSLSPGLEGLILPRLNLRNVTTTEVLSIVGSLLELTLEPVKGDDRTKVVAWLVKPAAAATGSFGSGMGGAGMQTLPAPEVAAATRAAKADPLIGAAMRASGGGGEAGGVDFQEVADPNIPRIAVVASGPGMIGGAAPLKQSKVFGIAALLPPPGDSDEEKKLRAVQGEVLLTELNRFAVEQDEKAEIRCYPGLNIIVVTSTALPLIAEALQEMKSDAIAVQAASQSAAAHRRGEAEYKLRVKAEHDAAAAGKAPEKPADH